MDTTKIFPSDTGFAGRSSLALYSLLFRNTLPTWVFVTRPRCTYSREQESYAPWAEFISFYFLHVGGSRRRLHFIMDKFVGGIKGPLNWYGPFFHPLMYFSCMHAIYLSLNSRIWRMLEPTCPFICLHVLSKFLHKLSRNLHQKR